MSLLHSRKRPRPLIVGLSFVLCFLAAGSFSATFTKQLAPGVNLTQDVSADPGSGIINVVSVDLGNPEVSLGVALGRDRVYVDDTLKGKEAVSSITGRTGALVGVNADYFPMEWGGDPLGVCVISGELVSEPRGNRASMAFTTDRKVFFDIPSGESTLTMPDGRTEPISGINRGRDTGKIVLLTEAFGDTTQIKFAGTDVFLSSSELPVRIGREVSLKVTDIRLNAVNSAIPRGGAILSGGGVSARFLQDSLRIGDTVKVRFDVRSPSGKDWSNVQCAVGGGPWLLNRGVEYVDWQAEGFQSSFAALRHPRTGLGVTRDNRLLIVTVDGRQPMSGGATLCEMAAVMQKYGAVDAINLDGGGSTTLSVLGMVVNSPSGFVERQVANALLVYGRRDAAEETAGLEVTGVGDIATSGVNYTLALAAAGCVDQPLAAIDPSKVVWGTTGGIGFVDQSGRYTPMRARSGSVCGVYGMEWATRKLTVSGGPAVTVQASLTEITGNACAVELSATAYDLYGNASPERPFTIRVAGGNADVTSGATAKDGTMKALITWDPKAKTQNVTVLVDKASTTVKREAATKPKVVVPAAPSTNARP